MPVIIPTSLGTPSLIAAQPSSGRHIWDMLAQPTGAYVWIGYGDANANTGPITIYRYDLVNGLVAEQSFDEEEIQKIRQLSDSGFYAPGTDSHSNDSGSVYRIDAPSTWVEHGGIPADHVFDVDFFSSRHLVAISPSSGPAVGHTNKLLYSTDDMATWNEPLFTSGTFFLLSTLFQFGGVQYASGYSGLDNGTDRHWLGSYATGPDTLTKISQATAYAMFGSTVTSGACWMDKVVVLGSKLLYLKYQFDLTNPVQAVSLWQADSIAGGGTVVALAGGETPRDLIVSDGVAYLLCHETPGAGPSGSTISVVYTSTNGTTWTEAIRFQTAAFLRSHERVPAGTGPFLYGADDGEILIYPNPGGGGMADFLDNFTGSDGVNLEAHTADSGEAWSIHPTQSGSVMTIASNRIRQHRVGGGVSAYLSAWTPPSADYSTKATLHKDNSSSDWNGITARMDPTAGTFYVAARDSNSNSVELGKRVAGFYSPLGNTGTLTWADGSDHTIELICNGTTISVVIDNGAVSGLSVTDASIAGPGGIGFETAGAGSLTNGVAFDSMIAGPIGGGGAAGQPTGARTRGIPGMNRQQVLSGRGW